MTTPNIPYLEQGLDDDVSLSSDDDVSLRSDTMNNRPNDVPQAQERSQGNAVHRQWILDDEEIEDDVMQHVWDPETEWIAIRDLLPDDHNMPGMFDIAVHQQMMADGINDMTFYDVPDRYDIYTLIDQEMDGIVEKWLELNNIEQHIWFYKALNYKEMKLVNKTNFMGFFNRVKEFYEKQPYIQISEDEMKELLSDETKICLLAKKLFERPYQISYLMNTLERRIPISELMNYLCVLEKMLQLPVPNRLCTGLDKYYQPQHYLFQIMQKACKLLMDEITSMEKLRAKSSLITAIQKFTDCVTLISSNQLYFKYQVDGVHECLQQLQKHVIQKKRDFSVK